MLTLTDRLKYGTLPGIVLEQDTVNKEIDLKNYVNTYLEQEIRAEALVRNIGGFSRFLELAAIEAGHLINYSKLSQDIRVAASTITDYYQILLDCMIATRIEPITETTGRHRLTKTPTTQRCASLCDYRSNHCSPLATNGVKS